MYAWVHEPNACAGQVALFQKQPKRGHKYFAIVSFVAIFFAADVGQVTTKPPTTAWISAREHGRTVAAHVCVCAALDTGLFQTLQISMNIARAYATLKISATAYSAPY